MKILFTSLLLFGLVISAACQSKAPDPAKQPFTLTLSAESEIKSGSLINVTIRMTNISDHGIDGSTGNDRGVADSYFYAVRDSDGNLLEQKKRPGPVQGGGETSTLRPGETLVDGSIISRLYDLTKPGKYTVQVSRLVSYKPGAASVISNTITVTVVP